MLLSSTVWVIQISSGANIAAPYCNVIFRDAHYFSPKKINKPKELFARINDLNFVEKSQSMNDQVK